MDKPEYGVAGKITLAIWLLLAGGFSLNGSAQETANNKEDQRTVEQKPVALSPGIKTDYGVHPEPPPPALPSAGGKFTDPTFGTTIMRVTDSSDGAFNSTSYSYWPSLNLNNSRLFIIAGGSPTLYDFDPSSFSISNKRPLFAASLPTGGSPISEDAFWSGTDPNTIFCHAGLRLWSYNVASNSYRLVKDFSSELPSGHLWQMSKSKDDQVFAFTRKDANFNVAGYVVWRRDTNSIRRTDTTDLDEVQLDKTGAYLIVLTQQSGSANAIEAKVVNLQTGGVENLTDGAPDYAPGHKDMGSGFVIGGENWNNRFLYRRMATPHQYTSVMEFGNDWSVGSHVSMLADNEGWMMFSTFVANSLPSSGVFRKEIFQVATDGSKRVRRLAHVQSVYREYWDSPRANISRDGRFVVFTSNWGSTSRRDVFMVRIPPAPVEGGPAARGDGNSSDGKSVAGIVNSSDGKSVAENITGTAQNVVWANAVRCAVTGNSLKKISGQGDAPDAGANSRQAITSGDGYAEFTVTETDKIRFCGLTRRAESKDIASIDFAIKLTDRGVAEVRENNLYETETSYRSGDVFRISVERGAVKYYKNGSLFHTSLNAPGYPLIAAAVLVSLNATIKDVVMAAVADHSRSK